VGSLQEALAGCLWLHVDDTLDPWPWSVGPTQARWPDFPVTDKQVIDAKRVAVTLGVERQRPFVLWVRKTVLPTKMSAEWQRVADYISSYQGGVLATHKARDMGVDHFLDLLNEERK
jgi:hypothetical protein